MVDIANETDIELLRQTAQLLVAENDRLHRRLAQLTKELATASGRTAVQLELEIQRLQEQLAARKRDLYGDKSEKRKRKRDKKESPAQAGHGPRTQAKLPIEDKVHELDEADRICPQCGNGLDAWEGQTEDGDEIDVVERSFRIVRHRRQKYRCSCGCIETALGPDKLIKGGRYSVSFAVDVAVSKYSDHLPLTRQARIMGRAGLEVNSQTLWDQIQALSRHLEPSYQALQSYVLESPVIGADETTWRLMEKKSSKKWWVWATERADAVFYRIDPSRSAEAASQLLGDYAGIVVADGYSAYNSLQKQRTKDKQPTFELAACWAHVRRKFLHAEKAYPEAQQMIDWIGELYEIESRAGPEELANLREEHSRPLIRKMRHWLDSQVALPRSSLGEAISYAVKLWPALTMFIDNDSVPLDNNASERALRGVCVGRKNHYGSRSRRGTEVAAIFYSLIETAKLAGVEPMEYMREAAIRAIRNPGTVTLPKTLLAERDAELAAPDNNSSSL